MSEELKMVNQHIPKKDAYAIMDGGAVYTQDLLPDNALYVHVIRSPYAYAKIRKVNKDAAMRVPGVECILTGEDVPHHKHCYAGESFPGNNPYDRDLLGPYARYVGDPVALVAAKDEKTARKAAKLVKVDYEVLTPVLDFETAEGNPSIVHDEDDYYYQVPVGADRMKNVFMTESHGNSEEEFMEVYKTCARQYDEVYYTSQNQQAMMETHQSFAYYDEMHRLTILSSTQVPFHVRRVVGIALGIPKAKIRVIKPRIGGGFGAKQSIVTEVLSAAVTFKTGKPAYVLQSRKETFACANTRHEFRIRIRLGADLDGNVRALWMDSLENVGAYDEHAVNVVGLSAHKTLPLYGHAQVWRYTGKGVYTNTVPGGAFRGYGATQGCFAVETTINKMAMDLGLDPTEVRLKNMPEVGKPMPAYYNEILGSCTLDRCIKRGREMFRWDEKFSNEPFSRPSGKNCYRGVGMAVTMQGSGLTKYDVANARIALEEDNFYALSLGSTDMGTGSDTILAQMAAEVLMCDVDQITVNGVDTLYSPYDKGSYASSTTYVTGNAVILAAQDLKKKLIEKAATYLDADKEEVTFDGAVFSCGEKSITLYDMAINNCVGDNPQLVGIGGFSGECSPPPFVAGFAEVEVNVETGKVKLCDYVGVCDCGTVINKSTARVQLEGGLAQGIGMAMYENIVIDGKGKLLTDNFMQYKIPSRLDMPEIRVAFEESYEPTGPFGAKSIGEVVINTPSPAIVSAIRNAIGVEINSLPATSEKVLMAYLKNHAE